TKRLLLGAVCPVHRKSFHARLCELGSPPDRATRILRHSNLLFLVPAGTASGGASAGVTTGGRRPDPRSCRRECVRGLRRTRAPAPRPRRRPARGRSARRPRRQAPPAAHRAPQPVVAVPRGPALP